jgi:hypothetical protein
VAALSAKKAHHLDESVDASIYQRKIIFFAITAAGQVNPQNGYVMSPACLIYSLLKILKTTRQIPLRIPKK